MSHRLMPRRLVLILLSVLIVGGCGGSGDEVTYGVEPVQSALQEHGLDVELVLDRRSGASMNGGVLDLVDAFDRDGLEAVFADVAPDGATGGEISAWVFDTSGHAGALQGENPVRLQRSNVVVLTNEEHEAAAAAALDGLEVDPPLPEIVVHLTTPPHSSKPEVVVGYCFKTLPSDLRRRPWQLHVGVDNRRDSLPPFTLAWEIKRQCGTIRQTVGRIKPPYTLRINVESYGGGLSRTLRVPFK